MALSELIKYEGDNSTFIWKYPHEDFNSMTELVVHESQEVIFFANGQAADTFGPGRYKLDAENIPILIKLVNVVTGVSVFHCEVYFINKTVQMSVKWGTDSKVRFVEPTMGIPIELGASGEMNLAVSDGRKMLINLVGTTSGIAWDDESGNFTKSLQKSFRPMISTAVKSQLPTAIKRKNIDIVEVDQHLMELSDGLRECILPGFEEYGLTIPQLYLSNVVLPESDPNFKRLRELHTISFQKRVAEAEAEVRTAQAQSKAAYVTAEAQAQAQINIAQREAILESQTTETEIARREAERTLIQAQAEAQATQMAGMAEAAVMQAQGYNQKDVLQAEVQKSFAEGLGNMGPDVVNGGGGSSSVMGDMMNLGMGMAAMNAMAPQMGEMMKGFGAAMPGAASDNSAVSQSQNQSQTKCPNCGNSLPANAKFCMECGQPLANICPNCGANVPQGGKFCLECGTKL
ncbi:MAG: SPFH domain-containing protein [Firmicutes bacterium]|nr:SPFH domain-containing protein [Bacillota bacterium]